MNTYQTKKTFWRAISAIVMICLVLCLVLSWNGTAVGAPLVKGGKGKHKVELAPVAPPTIQTQPLKIEKINPKPKGKGVSAETGFEITAGDAILAVEPAALPNYTANPRDMKILVITPTEIQYFPDEYYDTRYRLTAIKAFLDQIGIPYDVHVADTGTLTAEQLYDPVTLRGKYQGIILENGSLLYYAGGGAWYYAFTTEEWNLLWDYERMFGVRQLAMYVAPYGYPETYGLAYSGEGYLNTTMNAALTSAGSSVYPYISGPTVPFINTYFYRSTLESNDPHPAVPLLNAPDGSPVAVVHNSGDGRETLAITVDYTGYLISSLALSYGNINWLTKGVFLGERHTYLAPQVDDLLIDDNLWDPVAMHDLNDNLTYRITANDLQTVLEWQNNTFPSVVCVTTQPGPVGKDSYIDEGKSDQNFGNNGNLYTRSANKKNTEKRSLIQFDLSFIPQGAQITSAKFSIYLTKNSGSADTVNIYPLSRDWLEGAGGRRKGVSWLTYDLTNRWTNPGGDYLTPAIGAFTAGSVGWKEVTITNAVRNWRASPASNFGMILLSAPVTNTTNNDKVYISSDSSIINQRPKLEVCFEGSGFMLEFAFNGEGAQPGVYDPDTLTPYVVQNQSAFRWINHTYNHLNLDYVTYNQAYEQLVLNDNVAVNQLKLTYYSREPFIQPDISGLYNVNFQSAAYNFGVRYLISDTSWTGWNNPSPNTGIYSTLQPGLLIIPRHPTNLFYNLSTPVEWVSEYNCYYGPNGTCADGQWRYWDHDLSYSEILDKESDMMLLYLLRWDVDPLMFHQTNLKAYTSGKTLMTDLIDATLAKYQALINLPIYNPSHSEVGVIMSNRMKFNASGITGTLTPCSGITLKTVNAARIPLTGVAYGSGQETYGGQPISYINMSAGQTIAVPLTCP